MTRGREEHLAHVLMVLETLRHHKLYAKALKCQFGRSSVGFVGHVISERCVAVDPARSLRLRTQCGVGPARVVHGRAPLRGPR